MTDFVPAASNGTASSSKQVSLKLKRGDRRGKSDRFRETRWNLERLGNHYVVSSEKAGAIRSPLADSDGGGPSGFGPRIPRIVEMDADLRPYHAAVQTVAGMDDELGAIFHVRFIAGSLYDHRKTTENDRAKAMGMSRGSYEKALDRLLMAVAAIVHHETAYV